MELIAYYIVVVDFHQYCQNKSKSERLEPQREYEEV